MSRTWPLMREVYRNLQVCIWCAQMPRLFNGLDCFTVSTCCTYIDLGSRGYFGVNVALVFRCNRPCHLYIPLRQILRMEIIWYEITWCRHSGLYIATGSWAFIWNIGKIVISIIVILIIQSDHNVAHGTTAELSCHVQHCVLIVSLFNTYDRYLIRMGFGVWAHKLFVKRFPEIMTSLILTAVQQFNMPHGPEPMLL